MLSRILLCTILGFALLTVQGQEDLYHIDSVQEIRIEFDESNWEDLLDTLFLAGDNERLIGDITINGVLLPDVGVRYKGFSSYSSARKKNPFNIKLNHVHAGQRFDGVDKLKLSNVIQDPSFIREALSYEIARKYMPASEANFARVFVNDEFIGLYTNVEAVNNEFTDKHFGTRDGSFIKGNPEQVDLNGENANLSNAPGVDSSDYQSLYKLESTYGWNDLVDLIQVLNTDPDSIHNLIDVDRALWMHAFNMALMNFDSYVGYAQNYYIYRDRNGLWNTIPWDLNMSFASFRLTDASTFFNGFSIAQAKIYDPLAQFTNFLVHPRPLFTALMQNDTYRKMYLAHLRTIIEENFANGLYYGRASSMQSTIASDVIADTNKFYSNDMFIDNLDSTVSDLIDYPGIKDLMEDRTAYLQAYPGYNAGPTISVFAHTPTQFIAGSAVNLQVPIANADTAFVAYRSDEDDAFKYLQLFDDGLHQDGMANDGLYGNEIFPEANYIQLYFYAENDSAGSFSPARAAYEFHEIISPILANGIVINELMAANTSIADEDGEFDDWIELYNANGSAISTTGLYLSDDVNDPLKWALPQRIMDPGEYLIIWADEDEGGRHANFQLNDAGEQLGLYFRDSTQVDATSFERQYPVSSWSRYPNGTGNFQELLPTHDRANLFSLSNVLTSELLIYPNPSSDQVFIIHRGDKPMDIRIFSSDGRLLSNVDRRISDAQIDLNTSTLNAGLYHVEVETASGITQSNFTIIK